MADKQGQLVESAAETYDRFFVPALFAEWAPRVLAAAKAGRGDTVLDVACGTGLVALAAERLGASATGVDRNPVMLEVARGHSDAVTWVEGAAEDLPFDDGSFDAVTCQFGLMFFGDRGAAVREMWRVLRPGGRLAVAVWAALDDSPGYRAVTDLLQRLFGDAVANEMRAPFVLGDGDLLRRAFQDAGAAMDIDRVVGTARFPSLADWARTDIKGWTLADMIDDAQFEQFLAAAETELSEFVGDDGSVRFDSPALIATAQKA